MTWSEISSQLAKVGLVNFLNQEHFDNWRKWENDDIQLEAKIKKLLYEN